MSWTGPIALHLQPGDQDQNTYDPTFPFRHLHPMAWRSAPARTGARRAGLPPVLGDGAPRTDAERQPHRRHGDCGRAVEPDARGDGRGDDSGAQSAARRRRHAPARHALPGPRGPGRHSAHSPRPRPTRLARRTDGSRRIRLRGAGRRTRAPHQKAEQAGAPAR